VGAKKILEQFGTLENAIEHADENTRKKRNTFKRARTKMPFSPKDSPHYTEIWIFRNIAKIRRLFSPEMPKNLVPFLEEISSRNLITRAEKIFGAAPPPGEQMGMF
jgi:5'-3' exonuclease